MSAKTEKKLRQVVRQEAILPSVLYVYKTWNKMPFWNRVKFAWKLILGKAGQ